MNQLSAFAQQKISMANLVQFLPHTKQRELELAMKYGIWFVNHETRECLPPKKFLDKVPLQSFREIKKWELVPPFQHRRKLLMENRLDELAKFDELMGEENGNEKRNGGKDSSAAS